MVKVTWIPVESSSVIQMATMISIGIVAGLLIGLILGLLVRFIAMEGQKSFGKAFLTWLLITSILVGMGLLVTVLTRLIVTEPWNSGQWLSFGSALISTGVGYILVCFWAPSRFGRYRPHGMRAW